MPGRGEVEWGDFILFYTFGQFINKYKVGACRKAHIPQVRLLVILLGASSSFVGVNVSGPGFGDYIRKLIGADE